MVLDTLDQSAIQQLIHTQGNVEALSSAIVKVLKVSIVQTTSGVLSQELSQENKLDGMVLEIWRTVNNNADRQ